jgi:membrane-associated phospholipid phosphatase
MKSTLIKVNRKIMPVCFATLVLIMGFSSCNKFDDIFDHHNPGKGNKPTSYSSEVIEKWAAMQLRLIKNTTGVPNHAFGRHYAYTGVAAFESIAAGLPAYAQLKNEWNGLTGLPQAVHGNKYYWPANANSALAAINRSFFPNASATDKAAIDSLENAFNDQFLTKINANVLNLSTQFGKAVASAVWSWAETDGYKTVYPAYVVPVGDGLWKPTAPNQAPATPYWGNNRPVVKGSINGAMLPAPPAYSAQPGSDFYNMVKGVFDASKTLTPEQTAMAIFWKDVPGGATTPGHWISILQQVLDHENASLAKGAVAYALTGAGLNDAAIAVFKVKYSINLVRPVTYIHEVMGETTFNPLFPTPAHPEYPSAHSSLSAAVGGVLEKLFGNSGQFTDRTYDYLGYAPRSFSSYGAIAQEAGVSRLYAGIHYQYSIDKGLQQGKKVASNILDRCSLTGY